jgi:hypothetical protein
MAMTINGLPERFYRLLYFSPRPEDDERVCVGIILRDGNHALVDYDEKLEKAHCFAPDYTRPSIAFILQAIQADADRIALDGKMSEFSPQFSVSAPRVLLHVIDEKVRGVLRHRYLLKPKSSERKQRERGLGRKIDKFLTENLGFPANYFFRRATAEQLFGHDLVQELPKDLVPKSVSRALSAEGAICLMDGVDLHTPSHDLLVQQVNRVAHTFWQYKKVEELFHGKTIVRAAVVFDGSGPQVEPALKWRWDYAKHQFNKDAEFTIKAGSGEEAGLRDALTNLLPNNQL